MRWSFLATCYIPALLIAAWQFLGGDRDFREILADTQMTLAKLELSVTNPHILLNIKLVVIGTMVILETIINS
jgi:hypothetical protein